MKTINVATDFSRTPAGRFRTDGPASGERFREDFLKTPLQAGQIVEIHLDGAAGYPSSFLEEAFGGLIRHSYVSKDLAKKLIRINAISPEYQRYVRAVWAHIDRATPLKQRSKIAV